MDDERKELDELSELEDTQFFTEFDDANFDELLSFEEGSDTADSFGALTRPGSGIGIRSKQEASHASVLDFRLAESRGNVQGLNAEERAMLGRVMRGKRTFDKSVAGTMSGVRPVRIGDPFLEQLADYLEKDERGRAVAMLIKTPCVSDMQAWFGFDYLIEFDDQVLSNISGADRMRLRRRGDALFGPRVETVWSDGTSEAPPEIVAALPKISSADFGVPLHGKAWEQVLAEFSPSDWAGQCRAAANLSAQIVLSRRSVEDDISRAVDRAVAESEQRVRVMRARTTDTDRETKLAAETVSGLRRPRTRLLACVAAVLVPEGS